MSSSSLSSESQYRSHQSAILSRDREREKNISPHAAAAAAREMGVHWLSAHTTTQHSYPRIGARSDDFFALGGARSNLKTPAARTHTHVYIPIYIYTQNPFSRVYLSLSLFRGGRCLSAFAFFILASLSSLSLSHSHVCVRTCMHIHENSFLFGELHLDVYV